MKKIMIVTTLCLCISFLALGTVRAADEIKLGYVNAQRIIEESKAGKEAYGKLKELQEEHKTRVEGKKAEIDAEEAAFQKQYMTLSDDAKTEKEAELRRAKKDFKRMLEDADADIGSREKTYLEKIDSEVMEIIDRVGKEKGYTLILGQIGSSILYANPTIDLTEVIISEYDKTFQP